MMICLSSIVRVVASDAEARHWSRKIGDEYGMKTTMMPGIHDQGFLLRKTYLALSLMPASLVKACGVGELLYRDDMGPNRPYYPNHGYYRPDNKTITLNVDIFRNPDLPDDFFDEKGHFLIRPEQTLIHEFGHGFDEEQGLPSDKDPWLKLSGWTQDRVPGHRRLIIKCEGKPDTLSDWYYDPKSEFTRYYGRYNPWDDYADCFSFYVGGVRDKVPTVKRSYFDNYLDRYYS